MSTETVLSTLIGVIAGGVVSLGITHLYFLKGKGMDRIIRFMTFNLEKAMLPNIFSHFTSRPKIHLEFFNSRPKNLNEPHLTELIIPASEIVPETPYTVLFRVSDEAIDFNMSEGTALNLNGKILPVKDEPFGFMSFELLLPKTASEATYNLNFEFVDRPGNKGSHTVELYPLAHNKKLQRIAYGAR